MATSLGQLLDTLADTARTTGDSPTARADAATAIGHLGRALHRLALDGVSDTPEDGRERQLTALATAGTELAARAPITDARLSQLAAAAADLAGTQRELFTVAGRWAAAVEITDVLAPLTEVVGRGLPAGGAGGWLKNVQHSAVLIEHAAARHPPSRAGAALLDHPVPTGLTSHVFEPAVVIPEAVAQLVQVAGRPAESPSIAEVLAFTVAAQTLSAAAGRLNPGQPREPPGAASAGTDAADGWQAVRVALRPFGDGSRRMHAHAPATVQAAGRLHTVLSRDTPDPAAWSPPLRAAVAAAAQHLPALAAQLDRTVASWGRTGALLAYAADLPPREDRVTQHLRGHRPGGLVRADALDLRPVATAVRAAGLLSTAVAARAVDPRRPPAVAFPRRAWAAHRDLLDQPDTSAALRRATQQAQANLAAAPSRPTGLRRSR
jgi:hypothetical protein